MRITLNVFNKTDGTRQTFACEGAPPEELSKRAIHFARIFLGADTAEAIKTSLPVALAEFNKSVYGSHYADGVNVGDIHRYTITIAESA